MTSEEIIERLIDEKKLSVKEAMIIMKDLAEEHVRRMFYAENFIHRYSSPWYDASSIADNNYSYNTNNESK